MPGLTGIRGTTQWVRRMLKPGQSSSSTAFLRAAPPAAAALYEIERKFLVRRLPRGFARLRGCSIVQGYLSVSPDGTEARVRKCAGEMGLTIKGGTGVSRTEVELPLTREQFQALWPLTRGRRIVKTRFVLPHISGTLELDVYDGPLRGLKTVEIEFATRRDSRTFQPPDWFGPEITHQAEYKNQNLALLADACLLVAEPRSRANRSPDVLPRIARRRFGK